MGLKTKSTAHFFNTPNLKFICADEMDTKDHKGYTFPKWFDEY
jgi:hypothetical protein